MIDPYELPGRRSQPIRVLDATCSGRSMWADRHHPSVLYVDRRTMAPGSLPGSPGFEIRPDALMDFRQLALRDACMRLVVFDPPHLIRPRGKTGQLSIRYGELSPHHWKSDLRAGFAECFRVLEPGGVLVFKWSEIELPIGEVVPLAAHPPLFGHRSGRQNMTHWLTFLKP